jgi:hypothetical protein
MRRSITRSMFSLERESSSSLGFTAAVDAVNRAPDAAAAIERACSMNTSVRFCRSPVVRT